MTVVSMDTILKIDTDTRTDTAQDILTDTVRDVDLVPEEGRFFKNLYSTLAE